MASTKYVNTFHATTPAGQGLQALSRALFNGRTGDLDAAHAALYAAQTDKAKLESAGLADSQNARRSLAQAWQELPKHQQRAAQAGGDWKAVDYTDPSAPVRALEADQERGAAQEAVRNFPALQNAFNVRIGQHMPDAGKAMLAYKGNTPGVGDDEIIKSSAGAGHFIGKDQSVSLAGQDRARAADKDKSDSGHRISAGPGYARAAAYERLGNAENAEKSKHNRATETETERKNREAEAGKNIRFGKGEDGKNYRFSVGEDGKNYRQEIREDGLGERQLVAEAGKNARATEAEAGKDGRAADAEAGKDGRAAAKAGAVVKVTPADEKRLRDQIAFRMRDEGSDVALDPDAEASVLQRAASLYQQNKNAPAAVNQAIDEHQPYFERKDSAFNPLSKRSTGFRAGQRPTFGDEPAPLSSALPGARQRPVAPAPAIAGPPAVQSLETGPAPLSGAFGAPPRAAAPAAPGGIHPGAGEQRIGSDGTIYERQPDGTVKVVGKGS